MFKKLLEKIIDAADEELTNAVEERVAQESAPAYSIGTAPERVVVSDQDAKAAIALFHEKIPTRRRELQELLYNAHVLKKNASKKLDDLQREFEEEIDELKKKYNIPDGIEYNLSLPDNEEEECVFIKKDVEVVF